MLSFLNSIIKFNPKYIKLNGWVPDPLNRKYLSFDKSVLSLLPGKVEYINDDDVDLRPYTSPRHNQKSTSTCVAQSVIKALEIKRIIEHGHENHVDLSVLDLYYGARERMDPSKVKEDSGTHICLACDVLRDLGVCRDEMHPFSTSNLFKKPSVMASREGRLNRISKHFKIKTYGNHRLDDIIFNLKAGNPVVFGTAVGTDWTSYKGGKEPLGVESNPKGRHAICCVGFVDGLFIIENSWSESWGSDGFGFLTPEAIKHPSTKDLWVIVNGSEAWTEKK